MKATTQLPAAATNLPLALTPLVGRGHELASIEEILGRNRLATSREPLGVTGEAVWRLEPLQPSDAHRLFVERARQHDPRFIADPESEVAITAICTRVDHLPLAIELAAAGTTMMAPAELLTQLGSHLGQVAGGGSRLAPPPPRTVRATLGWSYQLPQTDAQHGVRHLAALCPPSRPAAHPVLARPS